MSKKYTYSHIRKEVVCCMCESKFTVSYNTYHHKPKDYEYKCPPCMKKHRASMINNRINNNVKEKEKLEAARKSYWVDMDPSVKNERIKKLHEGRTKWHSNLSEEENTAIIENLKNKANDRYRYMSDVDKDIIVRKSKMWWDSLPSEEKEMWSSRTKSQWDSLSKDERKLFIDNMTDYHNTRTQAEKDEIAKHLSIKGKERWNNLSEVEQREYSIRSKNNYHNGYSEWYASLSLSDKESFHKNIFKKSNGNNGLHRKFEQYFKSSILSSKYSLRSEELLSDNNSNHMWDYSIYNENNNLVLVVDLDGSYFHADDCDYNGMHSQEEYDERRFTSVPDGIKYHIIYEKSFSKSFELLIESVLVDYDMFVENQFNMCRSKTFPYPKYNEIELFKSWDQLIKLKCDDKYHRDISLNNREGDRIISHFHHSIYHARVGNKKSPYDAWHDDKLLEKVIKNRMIYVNMLNSNKILQGFNISKVAPKVSVFSAGRAKLLIHKYLNNVSEIFDPFSGFSGRMLGSMSLGKNYIGQDIASAHIDESVIIYNFIKSKYNTPNVILHSDSIFNSSGSHESLFTCPPYGNKETWDTTSNMSCDQWIDECLNRFKCKQYLFVVDEVKKYKNYIVDEIKNKSHFNINSEYVVLLK